MTRRFLSVGITAASAFASVALVLATAQAQQPQQLDPERAFSIADSDLDFKLTLEEFTSQVRFAPRLKNAGAPPEFLFKRLDADSDGSLTLEEYSSLYRPGFFAGAAGKGPLGKRALVKNAMPKAIQPVVPPEKPVQLAEKPLTAEETKFFESKIRPVLVTHCAKCHSSESDKVRGGLLVDSREGLLDGGDTGPAVVPGDLNESLLIKAIRYEDETFQMPPKGRLPDEVIADFEEWVKKGAPDPRTGDAKATARLEMNIAKGREFWAFRPPVKTQVPAIRNSAWPKTDIDHIILAALEIKGMSPVGDANKPTLIRRVTFDITGLPPTPEEVEAFVDDPADDAFAKVVDRLLASPRFGERWGRHWLDVARFAESAGKVNFAYPNAWRYRDWVYAAFNSDKPYDQFVKEQLAGDLLPANDEREKAEHVIATGFLAIGSKAHNTQNRKQFLVDLADEQLDVTTQAFLGLTVACARCHDHKFDPIPQRDYYALSGIFQSTQTCYGSLGGVVGNINPSPLIELSQKSAQPAAVPRLPEPRRKALQTQLAEIDKAREAMTPEDRFTQKGAQLNTRHALLKYRLVSFNPDGTARLYAMGVRERTQPLDSPLYIRGELDQPGENVPRGLLQVLSSTDTQSHSIEGSGRRELADWVASRANPLTARVMVNRVWLHLFGRGIVPTPDNFGSAGQPPGNQALLDTLAVDFMTKNWSVKQLIRSIVLSRAYQLASTHDDANFEIDPDNAMIWHMSKRRLEAEAIRDAILAIGGKLNTNSPVGSAVARAGEGQARQSLTSAMLNGDDNHRSAYLPIVRDLLPESLTLFDFSDPSIVAGERATTSGPSQALYLMNSSFIIENAEATAEQLRSLDLTDNQRIERVYLLFFARNPTSTERDRAIEFIAGFAKKSSSPKPERAAWTAFCQALFASAELRFID